MRFSRVTLERFGHFEHLDVDLSGDGLTILRGDNEAGKTTILHALRGALFGLEKTTYGFHFGGPALGVNATLVDRDGRTIEIARKKKKDALAAVRRTDAREETLDAAAFERYLGSTTAERYEAVFGFTHADLARGAEGLKSAGLAEVLAGGALGGDGARVHAALAKLEAEADALFTPRAQKRTINEALRRLREIEERRKTATLVEGEYRASLDAIAREEGRVAALDEKLRALEATKARVERLARAMPDHRERAEIVKRLASPELEASIDAERGREILRLVAEADGQGTEIARAAREAEAIEARAKARTVDEKLLAEEETIAALLKRVDRIAEAREKARALAARATRDREAFTAGEGTESVEALAAWTAPTDAREALEGVAVERTKLDAARKSAEDVRERAREDLGAIEREREALGAEREGEGNAELDVLARDVDEAQAKLVEVEKALARAAVLEEDARRRRARLAPALGESVDVEALALPSIDLARHHATQIEELRDRRAAAFDKSDAHEKTAIDAEARRDALVAATAVPTMEDLSRARSRRDRGWGLVKEAWQHGESSNAKDVVRLFAEDGDLARAYEKSVEVADRVGDRLRDESSRVAQVAELGSLAAAERAKWNASKRTLAVVEREIAEWTLAWRAVWSSARVEPAEPVAMSAWLEDVSALRGSLAEARRERGAAREIDASLEVLAKRARKWIKKSDSSIGDVLAEVRARAHRERELAVRRDEAKKRREGAERALQAAERSLVRLAEDERSLASRLTLALPALSLPIDLAPHAALRKLRAREERAAVARAIRAAERESETTRDHVTSFECDVAELLARTSRDAEGRTHERVVEHLAGEVARAREARTASRADESFAAEARARIADASRVLEAVTAKLDAIRPPGASDDATLRAIAERAHARFEVTRALVEIDARLARALSAGPARALEEEDLARLDADALAAEAGSFARSIEDARRDRNAIAESLGGMKRDHERLGGDAAARAQAEHESERAELELLVDRYASIAIARAVLERSVATFARDHQPAILRRASELVSVLTGGRYSKPYRPIDSDDLAVETRTGEKRRPRELSSGTREQVFFALRLAYVLEYCAGAEPLPIVADDVIVAFDPKRAARAFSVLADVAKTTQVLFLTCHDAVVDLARKAVPGVRVVDLPAPP